MSGTYDSAKKVGYDFAKLVMNSSEDQKRHRYWEPPAIPIDNRAYDRLRNMRICRVARWDTDTVTVYLKHGPSGLESRKVEVDKAIMVHEPVVVARIVNELSAELETEVNVYSRLEAER